MAFGHSGKELDISSIDSESKHVNSNSSQQPDVKLDKRGIPLVPQPTSDPLDPLNWSSWLKILVLLQVSLLAFLALFSASLIVSLSTGSSSAQEVQADSNIPRRQHSFPSPKPFTRT